MSFFWMMEHARELAARDEEVVAEAIARSVVFKANVVARIRHRKPRRA